jgi:hypothetical protein
VTDTRVPTWAADEFVKPCRRIIKRRIDGLLREAMSSPERAAFLDEQAEDLAARFADAVDEHVAELRQQIRGSL